MQQFHVNEEIALALMDTDHISKHTALYIVYATIKENQSLTKKQVHSLLDFVLGQTRVEKSLNALCTLNALSVWSEKKPNRPKVVTYRCLSSAEYVQKMQQLRETLPALLNYMPPTLAKPNIPINRLQVPDVNISSAI